MNAVAMAAQRRRGVRRWAAALGLVAAICAVSVYQLRREAVQRDAAAGTRPAAPVR